MRSAAAEIFKGCQTSSGDKPTPCYRVRIEYVLTINPPPTFVVEWREFGSACPDVVTPYRQAATFNIGSTPDKIDVVTADGTMSVNVQHLPLRREGAAAAAAKKAAPRTATGYSRTFSFEEAFQNAGGRESWSRVGFPPFRTLL